MPSTPHLERKIRATARAGIWFSTLALILALVSGCAFVWIALTDPATISNELSLELELGVPAPELSTGQAMLTVLIWLATFAVGIALVWTIRTMFVGIRDDGIFTLATATRVRRSGWLLFLIWPVTTVAETIETALMTYWADPTGISIQVGIDETDIYSILVGLVLVALGHIMADAVQIADENKAFV